MANPNAFFPAPASVGANTATVAASTASANAVIPLPQQGSSLRIFNAGAGIGFCRTGVGAQVAVVTDIPIAPNSVEVIRIPDGHDNFAVILSAGTQNVYITKGEGS